MTEVEVIKPQEGRQMDFVACSATEAAMLGQAGGGKALAVDTPIPTSTGWKMMGELKAGDTVFSETGSPCKVVFAFNVLHGRPCYEVVFSDGEKIIADEGHLWHTQTHLDRLTEWFRTPEQREARRQKRGSIAYKNKPLVPARVGTIKTTAQIRDSLRHLSYTNHSVSVCGPLELPESDLPIHPYVLGTWLGDGTSSSGSITTADLQTLDTLIDCGETINRIPSAKYGYNIVGLSQRLRLLGLKNNKHIPKAYLRASIEQRVALMQGLMDTDGYAAPNKIEFTTTSSTLRDGVYELLVSLGIKVSVAEGRATLYGKDCGPKWRICFVTPFPAFRLDRKLKNQKREGFRQTTRRRYIVSVTPIQSVPVRCISVDSPSRLYLAGKGMIPTHNSYALLLDFLYDYQKPKHNGIIFRKNYRDLEDLIGKAENIYIPLGGKFDRQEHVWRFPSGANLWMSYLEREAHVAKWKGWEFSWIGWDELSEFSKMPYLFMFSRLRCTDGSILKRVRSTSNPDGPGTAWVWERFVKAIEKEGHRKYFTMSNGRDVEVTPEIGVSREWFFSKRQENRILMDADPDYEKNLDLLPSERLRQAYKMGQYTTSDDPEQLIKSEWWEAAISGANAFVDGQKSFGVDYSEGGDKTIKYDGRGNQLRKATEWSEFVTHPEMARILVADIREGGLFQMRGGVDTVGTGAGVYTCMGDIDQQAQSRVNPIRHKDYDLEVKQEMGAVKLHFQNIQDQLLWKLREDFMFGLIDLSPLVDPEHPEDFYENIHMLKEEVLAFRFRENKLASGRMWISSSNDLRRSQWPDGKPCLGRSPDRAKALAIWNYVRSWEPESRKYDDKPQRGDYGLTRMNVKSDPVSAYI